MKKTSFLYVILVATLTLSGCKDISKSNDSKETTKSTMNSKNIQLTVVKPKTISPINNKDQSVSYLLSLVYDGLFKVDENYNVVTQLAKEYSLDSDGKSIDITLNDAHWHDGSSVTASDVKFTVDLISINTESPYNHLTSNISNVTVINEKQVKIHFNESNAFNKECLVFPIVSKDNLGSTSDVDKSENNLIGNGPYKINKYDGKSQIELVKNENYYKKIFDNTANIDVSIVPTEDSQVSMVMALKSDIANIGLKDLSKFQSKNAFNITNYEGREYESVIFNYQNEFLNDANFRKAIAYSIDKKSILSEAFSGNATLINFPLNSKSKYYGSDIKDLGHDINKAKSFLDKAKPNKSASSEVTNVDNSEGKDNKDTTASNNTEGGSNSDKNNNSNSNEPLKKEDIKKMINQLDLKIIVNKDNTERIKAAHLISDNLKNIGIKSTVKEMNLEEIDKSLNEKTYDLALVGWDLSVVPDVSQIVQSSGYSNDKLTSYLESLKHSTEESQKIDVYKSIQKHVRDNVSFLSLVIRDNYMVTNNRLSGKLHSNVFDVYDGITNLAIK